MKNVDIFNKITRTRDPSDTSRHKDLIELARINRRSRYRAPQETFYNIIYNPDKKSPFFPNYDPLKQKDFNEADKEIRNKRVEQHKQMIMERTNSYLNKEVGKWDNMNRAIDNQLDKVARKREIIQNACSNKTHGFNIISMEYEKGREGSVLQQRDMRIQVRLQERARTLYSKNNTSFNILTAIDNPFCRIGKENSKLN